MEVDSSGYPGSPISGFMDSGEARWKRPFQSPVHVVEPTHYRGAYPNRPDFPFLDERSVSVKKGVVPVLTPPVTPDVSQTSYPGMSISNPYFSGAKGQDPGVSHYEVLSASIRNFRAMEDNVLNLHRSLNFPLPPPLHKADLNSLTPDQLEPGSVRLSLAMANAMREAIEQHEADRTEQLNKKGRTTEAFHEAILRSYQIAQFSKTTGRSHGFFLQP